MRKVVLVAFLTLCLTSVAQVPPQPVTLPEYVVVFEVIPVKPTDPVARINVLVRGSSEGDAAIAAFRFVEQFFADPQKLRFLEAAIRPAPK